MPLNDETRERLEGWKRAAMALAPLLLGEPLTDTPDELRIRYNRELALPCRRLIWMGYPQHS